MGMPNQAVRRRRPAHFFHATRRDGDLRAVRSQEITVVMHRRPTPKAIQIFHFESLPQHFLNVKQRGHGAGPEHHETSSAIVADQGHTQDAFRVQPIACPLAAPRDTLDFVSTGRGTRWKCGCRDAACTQSYWQIQSFKR